MSGWYSKPSVVVQTSGLPAQHTVDAAGWKQHAPELGLLSSPPGPSAAWSLISAAVVRLERERSVLTSLIWCVIERTCMVLQVTESRCCINTVHNTTMWSQTNEKYHFWEPKETGSDQVCSQSLQAGQTFSSLNELFYPLGFGGDSWLIDCPHPHSPNHCPSQFLY